MKFADGGSLAKAARQFAGRPRETVVLLAKVCRAVHYAHELADFGPVATLAMLKADAPVPEGVRRESRHASALHARRRGGQPM